MEYAKKNPPILSQQTNVSTDELYQWLQQHQQRYRNVPPGYQQGREESFENLINSINKGSSQFHTSEYYKKLQAQHDILDIKRGHHHTTTVHNGHECTIGGTSNDL